MNYVLPMVIGYLLGSVSFSLLIGKFSKKNIDIRKHGSGNAGATNTLRVLGVGPAIVVLLLDVLKGVAAVWLGRSLSNGAVWPVILAGLCVIIGHNWPVFFGFKGGKGIATTIGVMVTLCLVPSLLAGAVAILAVVLTRYVSLGSLLFTGLLPIMLWLTNSQGELLIASVIVAVFAFYKHRNNIRKLIQGKENKLGVKASN